MEPTVRWVMVYTMVALAPSSAFDFSLCSAVSPFPLGCFVTGGSQTQQCVRVCARERGERFGGGGVGGESCDFEICLDLVFLLKL